MLYDESEFSYKVLQDMLFNGKLLHFILCRLMKRMRSKAFYML